MQGRTPVNATLSACSSRKIRLFACPFKGLREKVLTDEAVGIPRSFASAASTGLPARRGNDEAFAVCYRVGAMTATRRQD